jgi:DNA-binding transcriptional MocR family regulator
MIQPSVYSVRAYHELRRLVPPATLRLSEGRNVFPPAALWSALVRRLFDRFVESGRISEYENAADAAERRLVANLLREYLDWPDLAEDCIFFVSGAQEGISLVYAWAARVGMTTALPLPVYYSFEQSACRWGVPVDAYVSADGAVCGRTAGPVLDVRIIPNPATGTIFPRVELPYPPVFVLLDAICQVGELDAPGTLTTALRDAIAACDRDRAALVMTASKDLSMPRLRAGVLVTRNPSLQEYARADRFERISAAGPLPGQVIAYYIGLLISRAERLGLIGTRIDRVAAFAEGGLDWLSHADVDAALAHWTAMAARSVENRQRLLEWTAAIATRMIPQAGYSALVDVDPPFATADAYLEWCREAGLQHSLRLNPCYVLGGTPAIWEALYPGRSLLRVNLSNRPDVFTSALDRLAHARFDLARA